MVYIHLFCIICAGGTRDQCVDIEKYSNIKEVHTPQATNTHFFYTYTTNRNIGDTLVPSVPAHPLYALSLKKLPRGKPSEDVRC